MQPVRVTMGAGQLQDLNEGKDEGERVGKLRGKGRPKRAGNMMGKGQEKVDEKGGKK